MRRCFLQSRFPKSPDKRGLLSRVLRRALVGSALVSLGACSAGGSGKDPLDVLANAGSSGVPGGGGATGQGGSTSDPAIPEGPPMNPTALCGSSDMGFQGLRRLSRREIENTLRDVFPSLGASWVSTLSADTISEAGFDNDSGMLLVGKQNVREVAATAESVATVVTGSLAATLPCAGEPSPGASCAEQFLDSRGRRLFRRPLSPAERSSFMGFFNTALTATANFNDSMGWLIRALVESPEFIYRREIGDVAGDRAELDQYEIASELAYTFSGTGPSDELLDRASRGELNAPEVLVGIARELLLGPAGREVVRNFFDSYVGHARVTTIAKAGVQGFAERRAEMLEETRRFIDEVVFNREGGPRELLTADFTTPSVALATFYGFQGATPASNYDVVQRPEGRGVGLLAQGSVLATLAQPNGSSPTKRGLWIFKRLLCNEVPPVPPNIPELGQPLPNRTTRQRYESDHAAGGCQACHSRWDPIGFGFEHYDEAGRYRATEGENMLPIDTQSQVPEQVDFSRPPNKDNPLFTFEGQEDLMTQLVEEPVVHQCLSGYLSTYAFGEELTCAAEARRVEFMDGTIGFIEYLASMAAEPHFTERRLE